MALFTTHRHKTIQVNITKIKHEQKKRIERPEKLKEGEASKSCVLESMRYVKRRIRTKIMGSQKQENKCVNNPVNYLPQKEHSICKTDARM